jgi:hypothetical protein
VRIDEDAVLAVDRGIVCYPFDGSEPVVECERLDEPQPDNPGSVINRPEQEHFSPLPRRAHV